MQPLHSLHSSPHVVPTPPLCCCKTTPTPHAASTLPQHYSNATHSPHASLTQSSRSSGQVGRNIFVQPGKAYMCTDDRESWRKTGWGVEENVHELLKNVKMLEKINAVIKVLGCKNAILSKHRPCDPGCQRSLFSKVVLPAVGRVLMSRASTGRHRRPHSESPLELGQLCQRLKIPFSYAQ